MVRNKKGAVYVVDHALFVSFKGVFFMKKRKKQILSIILASFVVLSVVATCSSATIDSLADGFVYIADEYGFTSSDILTYDGFTSNNSNEDLNDAWLKNIYPQKDYSSAYGEVNTISEQLDDIYLTDNVIYDNTYFIAWTHWNDFLSMLVLPEGTFVNSYNTTMEIYVPKDSSVTSLCGGVWNLYDNIADTSHGSTASYDQEIIIDDVDYYLYEWGLVENWQYIYLCNCPLYSIYNLKTTRTLEDESQLNYTDAYNSAVNGGYDEGEADFNNLYFSTSDFKWNVPLYGRVFEWPDGSVQEKADKSLENGYDNINQRNKWGSGSVTFTANVNDYQVDHADDFNIKFKIMVWQKPLFPTPRYNATPYGSAWQIKNVFCTSGYEVSVPLDDFVSGGNSYTMTMDSIFSNITITSNNINGYNNMNVSNGDTFKSYLTQAKECDAILYDNSTDLGWKIQISATLYSDNYPTESSGQNTETYNFLTQISKQIDDSMSTNEYPYSSDEDSSVDVGTNDIGNKNDNSVSVSNGGATATANASTGSITINNNNNNSLSSSDGSGFSNFLSTLITLLSAGQSSSSDTILSMTDANGFMTVANTALSAVPTSLWTILITSFTVCITITIVSVVLGLLIKIFT